MGITKLSKSGFKSSSYDKYDSFLAGNTAFNPSSYESIASVTVGSGGAADVTFSSIPATYTHLQIRMMVASTDSWITLQFNSDTGNNYAYHELRGNGSTAAAYNQVSSLPELYLVLGGSTQPKSGITDILDYTNTNKYTTIRTLGGGDTNGGGTVTFVSGLWLNTNAITSIKLKAYGTNFGQYSDFALYGCK